MTELFSVSTSDSQIFSQHTDLCRRNHSLAFAFAAWSRASHDACTRLASALQTQHVELELLRHLSTQHLHQDHLTKIMADTTSDPAMDYINATVTSDDEDQCPICTTKWGEIRETGEMELPWRCPDCRKLIGEWCLEVHIHTTPYPACHKCPCCRAWLEDFRPDEEDEEDEEASSDVDQNEEASDTETEEASDEEEDEEDDDHYDVDDYLLASREVRSWWTMEDQPDYYVDLRSYEIWLRTPQAVRRPQPDNDARFNDDWDVDRETEEEEAARLENAARIARCARPDFIKSGLSIQEFSSGVPELRERRDSQGAYVINIKPPMPEALRKNGDERDYRVPLFPHTLDQLCEDLEHLRIIEELSLDFDNAILSLCQTLKRLRISC